MRRSWAVPVAVTLATLALVAPPALEGQSAGPGRSFPEVELPPEVDAVLRGYEEAWRARDAGGLAALFAEDGFILRPGRPPVRGRGAIREAYTGSGGPLWLRAYEFRSSGSVGYLIGGFALGGVDSEDAGKYILLLHRDSNGGWLIAADMDNGNS